MHLSFLFALDIIKAKNYLCRDSNPNYIIHSGVKQNHSADVEDKYLNGGYA